MNRRRLLVGTAASALITHVARAQTTARKTLTLASFGARGDGQTDDSGALLRALSEYEGDLVIGAGTYRFAYTLPVRGSGRSIRFESGAKFVGDDPSVTGLDIRNATDVTISGASLSWRSEPRQRIRFGAGILAMGSTDVRIERCSVEGFAGAGVLFESCTRPVVKGARIRKTLADGVHFANCGQSLAEDVTCQDTGDDGLAFVNYRRLPDATGGTARRISVTNSAARGITVVGQSDVKVSDFKIVRTRASGIYVAQEDAYGTRTPRNTTFENGSVDRAGTADGVNGNRFGAELVRCQDVTLSSITITNSRARLVAMNGATGVVRLNNLTLRDNEDGEGVYLLSSQTVQISGGKVTNAFNTGIFAKDVEKLEVTDVDFSGCAERGASRTAVWLENVRDLRARFGNIDGSSAAPGPARVVLRGIGAGAVSVADASDAGSASGAGPAMAANRVGKAVAQTAGSARANWGGRRVSVMTENSPALNVEVR